MWKRGLYASGSKCRCVIERICLLRVCIIATIKILGVAVAIHSDKQLLEYIGLKISIKHYQNQKVPTWQQFKAKYHTE